MARVSQTTQAATDYKLAPTLTQPTVDGDVIDSGAVKLMVTNDKVGSIDVTVITTAVVGGLDVEDLVVPVAAGETALIGPFPKSLFGQPAGAVESGSNDQGRVYVGYGADTTDVTRAVIES